MQRACAERHGQLNRSFPVLEGGGSTTSAHRRGYTWGDAVGLEPGMTMVRPAAVGFTDCVLQRRHTPSNAAAPNRTKGSSMKAAAAIPPTPPASASAPT